MSIGVGIGIGASSEPEEPRPEAPVEQTEPSEEAVVEPLVAQALKASHVSTLPNMDLLYRPAQITLPGPPAGLDWNRMLSGWCDFDVVRINGLT